MKKVLAAILAVVLLGALGAVGFVMGMRPLARPAPEVKVVSTPEKVERGRYLTQNVSSCFHCHSQSDMSLFGTPPKPGTEGTGGLCLSQKDGFPGAVCAGNLTSDPETGLGQWTDGEIIRAIREGVSRDGRPLISVMPYPLYREMSDEDAEAIVAYLRTLPPVRSALPPASLDFPVNVIVRFMPEPLEGPVTAPSPQDTVAHGRYLVALGGCGECHTPTDDRRQPLPGRIMAGGREFELEPGSPLRSANLTPHATGLGDLSRSVFVGIFKQHALPGSERPVPLARNTLMGWRSYAGMTEADLGAIYDYLMTLPPVDNRVVPWGAPAVAAPAPP